MFIEDCAVCAFGIAVDRPMVIARDPSFDSDSLAPHFRTGSSSACITTESHQISHNGSNTKERDEKENLRALDGGHYKEEFNLLVASRKRQMPSPPTMQVAKKSRLSTCSRSDPGASTKHQRQTPGVPPRKTSRAAEGNRDPRSRPATSVAWT